MKKLTLRFISLTTFLLLISGISFAQIKPHLNQIKRNEGPAHTLETLKILPFESSVPTTARPFSGIPQAYRTLPKLVVPNSNIKTVKFVYTDRSGLPNAIYGEAMSAAQFTDPEQKIFAHLEAIKEQLQIENPSEEFQIVSDETTTTKYTHYKLQQYYQDVPVYGGELMVHFKEDKIHMINGRHFATPTQVKRVTPAMNEGKAINRAKIEIAKVAHGHKLSEYHRKIMGLEENQSELVIYHSSDQTSKARLAWRIEVVPNIYHRQVYFLDAQSEEIIFQQNLLCKAHRDLLSPPPGPSAGFSLDLQGTSQRVDSYDVDGTFVLIDASRNMFNQNIQFDPSDPSGSIWTLDAENETPIENDDFSVKQVVSNNANNWGDASSVSAHYNAGQAYEYFRTTFNRNSINKTGGSILSIINVADEDGSSLGNAFWSGSAMFYGNGDNAFSELARSLDVAGHEMSHGVVQTEANLEYVSQSGALNESFADIFGAMIDRDDWQVGEDVVNTSFFPSGALRDLSNPNNGGSGLNSNGWQPAHMNEYVNLPETEEGDNGGVHVNSGIPNRAFFLFASAVGKDVAEQVFYNALENYLTRFSEFVDLRIGVIASANELYNASVAAAAATAFDQVGIVGEVSTSAPEVEIDPNAGDAVVLFADANKQSLSMYSYGGSPISEPFVSGEILNKPSVSDDGTRIVYVDAEKNIQLVTIDWNTNQFGTTALTDNGIWRTAAISKDGQVLAALTDDFDDQMLIFPLDGRQGRAFTLVNPSTAEGVSTGNVSYADILEWSLNGESVMYDALSTIPKVDGTIEYWDIGFIDVWSPQTNDFGNGFISKLFSGLPDNVSVGNPTFSKNSPFIIALDYIDENDNSYSVVGVNVLTGDFETMFTNSDLSFPNYSVNDDEIIFDATNSSGNRVLGVMELSNDKISTPSNAEAFLLISGNSGARWGIVFATGERNLTSTNDLVLQTNGLKVYPNPTRNLVQIELESPAATTTTIQLFDQLGQKIYFQQQLLGAGVQKLEVSLENLAPGTYTLDIRQSNQRWIQRLVKIK